MNVLLAVILFSILPWTSSGQARGATEPFRFHLIREPHSLDPLKIRGSAGSYLFFNIYRSLYRIDSKGKLEPEGAKACTWATPLKLVCTLNPQVKWSDGSNIVARDYIRSFRRLVDPETKSIQTELLLNIKGARKILSGKAMPETLGIHSHNPTKLTFYFSQSDKEFLYKLTNPSLSPLKSQTIPHRKSAHSMPVNGPYKIVEWQPGKKIKLSPNPHYFRKTKDRPDIDVYLIEDDHTALRLYETGRLNFLRRVPTLYVPKYKNSPGFIQLPVARFDYIGLLPALADRPHLRKALALSLKYSELKELYHALGLPGCPSIPKSYMDKVPCHDFNLNEAKKSLGKAKPFKSQDLFLGFSKLGGQDIFRGMAWVQNQWKKHLDFNVELKPFEQGMYLDALRSNPNFLFRKGVGLDRPTCLSALEVFESNNRENYIKLNDPKYQSLLNELASHNNPDKKQKICRKAVELLVNNHYIIPLGRIHFSMLQDQKFTGWHLTELNQLDLSTLRPAK